VRVTPLEVGSDECPDGGVKMESGRNDGIPSGVELDGVLPDDEVEAAHIVCTGADGADGDAGPTGDPSADGAGCFDALIRVSTVDSCEACPAGGLLIESGRDDGIAGDGVLQPAMISKGSSRL